MRLSVIFAVVAFLTFSRSYAQNFDSLCLQQTLVISSFKTNHFSPPEFNTEVNKQILDLFLDDVDPRNLFLFAADKEKLADILNKNSSGDALCGVIQPAWLAMKKHVRDADSILSAIENSTLTFTDKDTIRFLPKGTKRPLLKDTKDLRARMEKLIRYGMLDQLVNPTNENEDVLKLPPAEMKKRQDAAKKKTISRYRKYFKEFQNEAVLAHHVADALSNAIALRCDPHSSYFNMYQKENWDALLATEELSFGFEADENEKGEIIVSELIPGGPAWKSNSISVDDVILGFQFEGENPVELEFAEADDFYSAFYSSKAKSVELKLRKKDNQIKRITIHKEKIQSQENVLNSYILSEKDVKMGYIPIPSFYSDAEGGSAQGVANDVAKEIVKLKQDGIGGLILDLRYNGGGSMQEAMGLAGIFIDEGPLSIYKQREDKPRLLKDFNRGSIWDGPLLILVNGASASASEFLTATLQDYNRAVIAGSTTFGKGTAQIVIPVDTNLYRSKGRKYYINPTLGYVKVTTGKFYRVTAKSHQGKGIEPDVRIPDLTEKLNDKESAEAYFLPADSVNKKVVYTKNEALPLQQLNQSSINRIEGNKKFIRIESLADSLQKSKMKEDRIILNLTQYKNFNDRSRSLDKQISYVLTTDSTLTKMNVRNNSSNEQLNTFSDYQRRINEDAISVLKSDLILTEAFYIISDLKKIQNK